MRITFSFGDIFTLSPRDPVELYINGFIGDIINPNVGGLNTIMNME